MQEPVAPARCHVVMRVLPLVFAVAVGCQASRVDRQFEESPEGKETKPSGYVDDRLSAHREQLKKLAGGAIVEATVETWKHRLNHSGLEASGGYAEGGSLGDDDGGSLGVGGLGLRGSGAGGGGDGSIGLGSMGTIGYGSGHGSGGAAAAEKPKLVVVTESKIEIRAPTSKPSGMTYEFSDESVEGELVRPDAELDRSAPSSSSNAPARALKAGTTDDNGDFAAFLGFLEERTKEAIPAGAMKIDVRGRRFVRVVDVDGRPVPGAAIVIRDWKTEKVIATAKTYGDGRAPFYPSAQELTSSDSPRGRWLVEASDGQRAVTGTWKNEDEIALRLQIKTAGVDVGRPGGSTRSRGDGRLRQDQHDVGVPLDVLFLIDTTGSMGDEIERIKQTLLAMTAKVRQAGGRKVDLRYGAVLYRDVGDAYVTAAREFTGDIDAFDAALRDVQADGGGDTPESLNQGLAEAMVGVQWRAEAAKVAFLVADAVPHMDYQDDIPYGESLKDAVTLGIRVHAVAASGLADDDAGSLVFRQIAQYTRGRFIFIEYGDDVVKSAAAHGVTGPVASNNLDDILLMEIRREIDGWGVAAN
ncbi:MAG: VWA domain-containing protein [Deltaproteobacteria bacterium]|nr:VWA domain-containing protein [Deltaproteobacteria bacterium]